MNESIVRLICCLPHYHLHNASDKQCASTLCSSNYFSTSSLTSCTWGGCMCVCASVSVCQHCVLPIIFHKIISHQLQLHTHSVCVCVCVSTLCSYYFSSTSSLTSCTQSVILYCQSKEHKVKRGTLLIQLETKPLGQKTAEWLIPLVRFKPLAHFPTVSGSSIFRKHKRLKSTSFSSIFLVLTHLQWIQSKR